MSDDAHDSNDIHEPHDTLARAVFSHVHYAAEEFRCALPAAIVDRLELSALQLCNETFVGKDMRKLHVDFLYRAPLDGAEAYIYLLMEHQSTVDKLMPFRLWQYMGAIWAWYLQGHQGQTQLPVVIPMVLHHSKKGWTGPRTIRDLFMLPEDGKEALEGYLPQLSFILDDISLQEDHELRARAMQAVPRLALWALKNARHESDLLHKMQDWVEVLREVSEAASGAEAIGTIMRYILNQSETDPKALGQFLLEQVGEKALEAYMTGAEVLRQEGVREGKREGVREGRREGMREGRREGHDEALRATLVDLLEQRFGALSPTAHERIAAADGEQLARWVKRVIPAAELADVFDG